MRLLVYILCIICIIWILKECRQLHIHPLESEIIDVQSLHLSTIETMWESHSPLLIVNVIVPPITISSIIKDNPGYIINDNGKMILLESCETQDISIYKNIGLSTLCTQSPEIKEWSKILSGWSTCNMKQYISFHKGYHTIPLQTCTHNYMLLGVLSSSAIVYIIHPKHAKDITHKQNNEIKKWSQKVVLKPGSLLVIPSSWLYFYECKGDVIIYHQEADSYSTFLYNSLR